MNPIEQKIREAGGTILSEPLLGNDGEMNPKFPEELFDALERPQRRHAAIWKAVKEADKNDA